MKTKNEVPPHARKTLQEVTDEISIRQDEIQQLIQVRTSLCELYEVSASLPMGNIAAAEPETRPKARRGRPPKTAPGEKAGIELPPPPARNLPPIPWMPKSPPAWARL